MYKRKDIPIHAVKIFRNYINEKYESLILEACFNDDEKCSLLDVVKRELITNNLKLLDLVEYEKIEL